MKKQPKRPAEHFGGLTFPGCWCFGNIGSPSLRGLTLFWPYYELGLTFCEVAFLLAPKTCFLLGASCVGSIFSVEKNLGT